MKIEIRGANSATVEIIITAEKDRYFLLMGYSGTICFSNGLNKEGTRGFFNGEKWEYRPEQEEARRVLDMFFPESDITAAKNAKNAFKTYQR